MKNSKELFIDFTGRIELPETREEIDSIGALVFRYLFGLSRTDILAGRNVEVDDAQLARLDAFLKRINTSEPVQYVLGEADFFGRVFTVTPAVLIPRPETEELVRVVLEFVNKNGFQRPHILDIGCGSGCIPVTLALEIKRADVVATDISLPATEVAWTNAERHDADLRVIQHDILTESLPVRNLDVITSNPPYVTVQEKSSMKDNVVQYEPHEALFVPDNDPMLFYRTIGGKAFDALKPGGLLAVEINEKYGREVMGELQSAGFGQVHVTRDMAGKDRIVSGIKPATNH